ncbi:MAG: HD domain-containing protein [Halobacteriota archaeon]
MSSVSEVRAALPEVEAISDADVRERVVQMWADAFDASDHESILDVPYLPQYGDLIGDQSLLDHVRLTTNVAIDIASLLTDAYDGLGLDTDAVVAGALVHDVSKVLETLPADAGPGAHSEIAELLGHPHYGQHLIAEAGLSVHLQHIALSHSHQSGVGIKTLEALVVWAADTIAVNSLFWAESDQLVPAFLSGPFGGGH